MSGFSGVDETRTCRKCNEPFLFSADEQKWMTEKNFDKPPNKCKRCRREDRETRNGGNAPSNGGYNSTGGYNASVPQNNNAGQRRDPAPIVEQKVYPSDYRDENNARGRKRRRRDEDNDSDW